MLRLDINLVFTVINLLITYFILRKFLFKPIHKVVEQRKEEIDRQYAGAKETEEKALALKAQYEESLSSVEAEKAKAVNEARTKAGEEYDRIVSDAKTEADKMAGKCQKTGRPGTGKECQRGTGADCRACCGSNSKGGCFRTGTGGRQGTLQPIFSKDG